MSNIRLAYAENLKKISDVLVSHVKNKDMILEEAYQFIIGATQKDSEICFQKIANALPDVFFINNDSIDSEIKEELVEAYILFMAQENITTQEFDENFVNFIYSAIFEISKKHYLF